MLGICPVELESISDDWLLLVGAAGKQARSNVLDTAEIISTER